MINIIKKIVIVTLAILFTSGISYGQMTSISSGEKWFAENKDVLFSLNHLLLNHHAIWRVDPGVDLQFVQKYGNFSLSDTNAYKNMESICDAAGIKNIEVARVNADPNGELIHIRYIIESKGTLVSGGSFLSISFVPNDHFLKVLEVPGITFKSLNSEGWYVFLYRDIPGQST